MSEIMNDSEMKSLVDALGKIVGPKNVLDRYEGRKQFSGDQSWLTYIHEFHKKPLSRQDAVATVTTTEQVAAIVRLANERKIPVTPMGGGSGVQGAADATRGGIMVNLREMNKIRHLDKKSLTVTVEPGYYVKTFEEDLNKQGLTFTHYPASAEWASVAGCLAARGSGVLSTKYGNIQDHVLSCEVVTPTGDILQLPRVPKHGAGPELTQLQIGAEGIFGIITACTLKLRNVPAKRNFNSFHFEKLASGIEAGRQIMTSGLRPAVMRLYDEYAALHSLERAVEAGLKGITMVLMFDGDHPSLVDAEANVAYGIIKKLGGQELGSKVGETWWAKRYVFYHPPYAPELPQMWCTMDVVSDFAHIENVYNKVTHAMKHAVDPKWGLHLKTHLSHWYEWGSMIYPRWGIPVGPKDLDEAVALHDKIIHDATMAAHEAGAVINDHHGVGLRLAPYMKVELGEAGMKFLGGIKKGVDPLNIMCPGKMGL
ncbi:MAG TPA: FAD-binding oxidoreductase [Planctomycetota bacterium]|nr:FAD-binding oxidoreductase [Planctomycetota bacterium]